MTSEEKRRHERIRSLNLSYICLDENRNIIKQAMGRTLNISESGILLETHFPVDPSHTLQLTIGLEEELLDIKGRPVHITPKSDGKYEIGVQFLEFDPDTAAVRKRPIPLKNEKHRRTCLIMSKAIIQTNFPDLKLMKQGKVRDIYDLGDRLLMVATDRISAFDVVMPDPIPDKGIILTQISLFWFEVMKPIVENHVISADVEQYPASCRPYADILRGRSMLVKKARPLPIECVVRGYLSGSGWKAYRQSGSVCGIRLPEGLQESDRLPQPIFTPSTKEELGAHDINIDYEEAVRRIGAEHAARVRDLSLKIYQQGTQLAAEKGIIIADTKFEFGLQDDRIILIDEVLTPDSSRFWPREAYRPGGPQKSYDKQYVRDYLLSIEWDKKPPGPRLPEEVVRNTRKKYLEALIQLTGHSHGL